MTAVYSRVSKDYVRAQNPDGSFQPETYVFREGGNFGGPRVDMTMDKLTFDDISKVIAPPLAAQNYMPGDQSSNTKLLIMVYWGTTAVPDDVNPYNNRESVQLGELSERETTQSKENGSSGPGVAEAAIEAQAASNYRNNGAIDAEMEHKQDAQIDAKNANLLGYTDEILRTHPDDPNMSILKEEIEHDRYYVVLLAYDYRLARKFGRRELLWETRFSIPETGNDFEKAFPMMASIAGKYFGQDSHGLIHRNLADTHVEVGEPKSLGALP